MSANPIYRSDVTDAKDSQEAVEGLVMAEFLDYTNSGRWFQQMSGTRMPGVGLMHCLDATFNKGEGSGDWSQAVCGRGFRPNQIVFVAELEFGNLCSICDKGDNENVKDSH